ncbi:DUF2071 domain-containing protein [Pseudolysinimonas sp.]|uniref:YqjF family protein n=1 Tax=Pseudolysinimonas sp. TaxID=2680009 RepID=UPI00286D312D|nr:DUF2071 domain-containing protein [Pseudolysinimonas sp.]
MTTPEPIRRTAPPLAGRVIASQRWSDLTFLHWRVDPAVVAPLLPPGVSPDEHDGGTWVGLIPFLLDRATLFGSPPVPYLGSFVEVNVRLYGVDETGRRGVVFLSLEASRLAAVLAARAVFGLPYFWSRTTMDAAAGVIRYSSRRHRGGPSSTIVTRPGELIEADPLADFLTARWGMFTACGGRTRFLPNEHEPWPVHAAELLDLDDELVTAAGLPGVTDRAPDSVLFSPGVQTRFGWEVGRPD